MLFCSIHLAPYPTWRIVLVAFGSVMVVRFGLLGLINATFRFSVARLLIVALFCAITFAEIGNYIDYGRMVDKTRYLDEHRKLLNREYQVDLANWNDPKLNEAVSYRDSTVLVREFFLLSLVPMAIAVFVCIVVPFFASVQTNRDGPEGDN